MQSATSRLTPVLLLTALSLFWGLNWPGMKIILSEMTVWWFRAACLLVGGTILMSISALSGNRCRLRRREIPPVVFCGCFAILGWMVCSAYGVSLMPAGRASIIAFTMPLWATLFAALVLGETIDANKVAGLLLGLAGLGVLIGPDLLILQRAPLGALFMLLAAISWGIGTVLVKRISWQIPTLSNVAWQLLASALPVTAIALLAEPLPDPGALSLPAMVALVYLFLFPMSFCQWAYFKTVGLLPASIAAIGTLTIPVIGVYSSHLILGEPVGISELLALALVLSALVLVLLLPALRGHRRARVPPRI
jgi:drug/metabolite transporter (DMT)-like permease